MNLVWIRKDLRIQDHPALYEALVSGPTKLLFIESIPQWKKHNESDLSIDFRQQRIQQLRHESKSIQVTFEIEKVDWFEEIPELLLEYCKSNKIQKLFFIKETAVDEANRDKKVKDLLNQNAIKVNDLAYDLIVSQPIYNLSGQPFKVFTPFYKKWLSMIDSPRRWLRFKIESGTNTNKSHDEHSPLSSRSIKNKLNEFCLNKINDYQELRDYPAIEATSRLSAYLAYGMIGPRQCLMAIKHRHDLQNTDWKTDFWLRELAWRDFYRQLMIHFPHLSKNQDFKRSTIHLPWREDTQAFEAWKEGQTGFPIIDAAMRQLNQTGWMHNRLRMLTASFLTKLLFIDWRKGEKYFMQNLIDGEFSANNGGWQWSASTGCDSAPYFRVFNPTTQSIKFDKNGGFIKKYIPELQKLNTKSVHNPSSEQRLNCNYPEAIIDYKSSRLRAIDLFKENS